jgi:hypothetical protein
MTKTTELTAERILAREGYDKNGFPIAAPKDTDSTIYDLERFLSGKQSTLPLDDDERVTFTDAIGVDDNVAEIATREAARSVAFRATGQNERADEAMQHAVELHALAKKSVVRRTLKTDAITGSDDFGNAVLRGDFYAAREQLVAAVKSDDGDHALKSACGRALIEIASLVGDDTGEDFNGAWLARVADIPLRTAQDLIQSANALDSGLASILIGTEHGGRKAFRKIAAMTPTRRREAMATLKECLTLHLIEFAGKREKSKHSRSICKSELKVLSRVGLNNEEGWDTLTELSAKDGKKWLATMVDKVDAAECKHGEDSEPARTNVKRILPSLTMQRLASERVYEL